VDQPFNPTPPRSRVRMLAPGIARKSAGQAGAGRIGVAASAEAAGSRPECDIASSTSEQRHPCRAAEPDDSWRDQVASGSNGAVGGAAFPSAEPLPPPLAPAAGAPARCVGRPDGVT
jgi:hypothetical protein